MTTSAYPNQFRTTGYPSGHNQGSTSQQSSSTPAEQKVDQAAQSLINSSTRHSKGRKMVGWTIVMFLAGLAGIAGVIAGASHGNIPLIIGGMALVASAVAAFFEARRLGDELFMGQP